jgi:fructose-1,6-bisphosphatase
MDGPITRKSKVRLTSWISHKAEEEERKRKTKKRQWSGKLVRGVFATVVVWGVWFYSGNTISDMVGELGNASSVGA